MDSENIEPKGDGWVGAGDVAVLVLVLLLLPFIAVAVAVAVDVAVEGEAVEEDDDFPDTTNIVQLSMSSLDATFPSFRTLPLYTETVDMDGDKMLEFNMNKERKKRIYNNSSNNNTWLY